MEYKLVGSAPVKEEITLHTRWYWWSVFITQTGTQATSRNAAFATLFLQIYPLLIENKKSHEALVMRRRPKVRRNRTKWVKSWILC